MPPSLENKGLGARPSEQALALRVEPASGLAPSGFDPSRAWRTDKLYLYNQPIHQFVLLEGYQEHSGRLWARKWAGTATISNDDDNRWGYRREDIDRIQRDGDMLVVERIAGWVPASWPRFDWFTPAVSALTCPMCTTQIDPDTKVCPSCKEPVA